MTIRRWTTSGTAEAPACTVYEVDSQRGKPNQKQRPASGRRSGDVQLRRSGKRKNHIHQIENLAWVARREARLLARAERGEFIWDCPILQDAYDRAFEREREQVREATEQARLEAKRARRKRAKARKKAAQAA